MAVCLLPFLFHPSLRSDTTLPDDTQLNNEQQNRPLTKEQWLKVLLFKGNLWQEYVAYGVVCVHVVCVCVRVHEGENHSGEGGALQCGPRCKN